MIASHSSDSTPSQQGQQTAHKAERVAWLYATSSLYWLLAKQGLARVKVYRFSAVSLHNCMRDSFSLDTYHLEHICEDTQSRIFELCSSRGGLRFRRAAISSKWERRVDDRRINPQSCTTKTKCGNKSNGEETSQKELHSQSI